MRKTMSDVRGKRWCFTTHESTFVEHMSCTDFKQMIDHSWEVEFKGGSAPFLAELVIICTNWHPKNWWELNERQDEQALLRGMNPPIGIMY